jgi:hypothetical protein
MRLPSSKRDRYSGYIILELQCGREMGRQWGATKLNQNLEEATKVGSISK